MGDETGRFRFVGAATAGLAGLERVRARIEALVDAFHVLELGDLPDAPIEVHLVEIDHGEPPEADRGVDVTQVERYGLRAYCDPRIRVEWLERDLVKLLVTEQASFERASGGPDSQAARERGSARRDVLPPPLLIDGIVGHLAIRLGRLDANELRRTLRAHLEAGETLRVGGLFSEIGEMARPKYHAVATSFVGYLLEKHGGTVVRRLVRAVDPSKPDPGVRAALGIPLSVLEEGWLATLRRPDVTLLGIGGMLMRCLQLSRNQWKAVVAVITATMVGLAFDALLPLSTRFVIDRAIVPRDSHLLLIVLFALLGLFVAQALVALGREYLAARTGSLVADELRVRLFEQLQRLSSGYYARMQVGDLVTRMTLDAGVVEQALAELLPATYTLVFGLSLNVVILFVLEARLAAIALVAAPLFALGMRFANRRSALALHERTRLRGRLGSVVAENFLVQPVVKAFGLAPVLTTDFRGLVGKLYRANHRVVFLMGFIGLCASLPIALVQVTALGTGAWFVIQGQLSIGSLVAFISVLGAVLGPLKSIAWVLPAYQRASTGLHRLDEILVEEPRVSDSRDARPLPRLSREIRLSDVTFSYTGEQANLDRLTLTIPAGKSVVFVGPSGCGKSTVLNLVCRFYDPTHGSVTFDGHDLAASTQESLRDQIGFVFQESLLFDASVRENIRMGKLDATDSEIEAAARAAEIHDAILALPEGYETEVGERGGRLSGGQRQRIAIARALIRDPAILVLDEATSALDAQTESAINATLQRATRGRTVLAVTHRLGWAENADLVFVMEKGHVAQVGTHHELLAGEGLYRKLWLHQRGFVVGEGGRIIGVEPERLRQVPVLASLSEEQLAQLAVRFVADRRAAGDVIVRQDARGDQFYIVARGQVEVGAIDPTGVRRHLATLRDGDHFGEIALLHDVSRTATVVASAPTELLVLDRAAFSELLDREPQLRAALVAVVESRRGTAPAATSTTH